MTRSQQNFQTSGCSIKVALGTRLLEPLATLRAALDAGQGVFQHAAPQMLSSGTRRDTGAKFARP